MQNERPQEENETITMKKRIKRVLKAMAPDMLHALAPEHEQDSHSCSQLLNGILNRVDGGYDFTRWPTDVRERLPLGSSVTLVAVRDGHALNPLTVRLNRPLVFLAMCEEYIATGAVSQKLLDDVKEDDPGDDAGELDEDHDFPDSSDEDARHFQEMIRQATTVKRLAHLQKQSQNYPYQVFRAAGIFAAFDAAAEKLIGAEIASGLLQNAEDHIKGISFFDKQVAERLRNMISEKGRKIAEQERDMGAGTSAIPTNATEFEKRAARAASIEELAGIAREAQYAGEQYAPRSIDTLAKQMFKEACDQAQTIEEYRTIQRQLYTFPFSQSKYGEEVKENVEKEAKRFLDAELIRGAKERGEKMSVQEVHTDALKEWNASPFRRLLATISRIVRNKN